jgi:hypothetical protein
MLNINGSRERPCSASCAQAMSKLPEGARAQQTRPGPTISQNFVDEIPNATLGGFGVGAQNAKQNRKAPRKWAAKE